MPNTVLSAIHASFHVTHMQLHEVRTITISTVSMRLSRWHSWDHTARRQQAQEANQVYLTLNNPKYYCLSHFDTFSNFKSVQPYSYSLHYSVLSTTLPLKKKAILPRAVQNSPQLLSVLRVLQHVLKNKVTHTEEFMPIKISKNCIKGKNPLYSHQAWMTRPGKPSLTTWPKRDLPAAPLLCGPTVPPALLYYGINTEERAHATSLIGELWGVGTIPDSSLCVQSFKYIINT